jgi:hypothetical protein
MTIQILLAAIAAPVSPAVPVDMSTAAAINAACYDYIDAQLEGNVARLDRILHPDLAMRSIQTRIPHRPQELEIETRDMLLDATRRGVLRKPRSEWDRSCRILDVTGNSASVRMDEGGFVVYFHIGNFDGRWMVVDGFWARSD